MATIGHSSRVAALRHQRATAERIKAIYLPIHIEAAG
jgi:hypothetical protein